MRALLLIPILLLVSCTEKVHDSALVKIIKSQNKLLPFNIDYYDMVITKVELQDNFYVQIIKIPQRYIEQTKNYAETKQAGEQLIKSLNNFAYLKVIFDKGYKFKVRYIDSKGSFICSQIISEDDVSKYKYKKKSKSDGSE